jgi:GNAT superfamily N-acetyltransferase
MGHLRYLIEAEAISLREEPRPADVGVVRDIVTSSGYFYPEEIAVAVELVEERLSKGIASGYHFVFAEMGGEVVGYACFGPIACTRGSYDLYWVAVLESHRGKGLGSMLMLRTESRIREMGGCRLYVETSSRDQYAPTRGFYLARGYREEAVIEDFYAPADHKMIYCRVLDAGPSAAEENEDPAGVLQGRALPPKT